MGWMAAGTIGRLAAIPVLLLVSLSAAGCSGSFCVGSGCDNGKIFFGSNFKQSSKGGDISVVGKTDTFHMGQKVAMVADLSDNAKATTLSLQVSRNGTHHAIPYHISSAKSNVLASLFTPTQLQTLGVTSTGTYTFRILRGSKQLAKGSMTEK